MLNRSGVETLLAGSSGALAAPLNIDCHSENGRSKVITAWKSSLPRSTEVTSSKPEVLEGR